MSDPVYLKCACQKCGGRIAFAAINTGMTVDCPHCGAKVALVAIQPEPAAVPANLPPKKPANSWVYLAGVSFLILVLAGAGAAIYRSKKPKPTVTTVTTGTASILTNTLTVPKALKQEVFTQVQDFEVGPISLKKTEGSSLVYAVGVVKNATDRQRFGVRITLEIVDGQETEAGSTSDYIADLEPHKNWSFNALITVPKVKKVTFVKIEEQQ